MAKVQQQAWMAAPETRKVMEALLSGGGDARFVGGCVRDALVNRPVFDIDIATPLTPDAVIERLTAQGIRYAPTGLKHGTVTAIVEGQPFEITTLRVDVESHGRHADVAFTDDWQADAARRDFTFNALYATPDGEVSDFFGGIADLHAGRVRFVGDAAERIREDVLRILRFFRFHAHFGKGAPDREAIAACAAAAGEIPKLSAERLRQETLKLLDADSCAATWRLMRDCGVVKQYLPQATQVDVLERLVRLEDKYETHALPLRRLAALLEKADGVADALRLSNAQSQQLTTLLDETKAGVKETIYRDGNDTARSRLLLAAARTGEPEGFAADYALATDFTPPPFPLRGEDALAAGAQGPEVGQKLRAVEDWWIANDFRPDRAACLEKLATA